MIPWNVKRERINSAHTHTNTHKHKQKKKIGIRGQWEEFVDFRLSMLPSTNCELVLQIYCMFVVFVWYVLYMLCTHRIHSQAYTIIIIIYKINSDVFFFFCFFSILFIFACRTSDDGVCFSVIVVFYFRLLIPYLAFFQFQFGIYWSPSPFFLLLLMSYLSRFLNLVFVWLLAMGHAVLYKAFILY